MSEAEELVEKFVEETQNWTVSIVRYLSSLLGAFEEDLSNRDEADADEQAELVKRRNVLESGGLVMVSRLLAEFKESACAMERRLEAMGDEPKSDARKRLDRFWLRISRELNPESVVGYYGRFAWNLNFVIERSSWKGRKNRNVPQAEQDKLMAGFVEYHKMRERG